MNAVIDLIADTPMSPVGRIAARRLGSAAEQASVPATEFDDRPIRVLIAPVNYSGQGAAWANALERADTRVSARSMAMDVPGGFRFAADLVVPVGVYHNGSDWQQRQLRAASSATHVLIEAEEPPFGRLLGRSVEKQASALLDAGVDVAYLAHGTDVRLPSRHIAENPMSYFADDSVYRPRAETVAARNIDIVLRSGRPLFVSTPDLLLDLPSATWCPVVVDRSRWHVERTERPADAPLRVGHAPSVAAAKGTPLIMPVLETLAAEGLIEITLIQGVASEDMPAAFAGVDVVLDQFRTGSYGVAACEAMAAGCVVVGQVSSQVRQTVQAQTGRDLPVIEATHLTLEDTLRRLAAEHELEPLRESSREFVHAVHDGRLSAQVLMESWIQPSPPPRKDHDRASRR